MISTAKNKHTTTISPDISSNGGNVAGSETSPFLAPDAPLTTPTRTGFTMCPNWIYDSLLIEETPSVIKVVLFFNRNTTGRTDGRGERLEFKQATYNNIANRLKMSVRAVGEAMRTALARGYLVQRRPETGGSEKAFFEGDFYALNWNWPLRSINPHGKEKSGSLDNTSVSGEKASLQEYNKDFTGASFYSLIEQEPTPSLLPLSEEVEQLDLLPTDEQNSGQARQEFPGIERQNLPTCINKGVLENKKIELKANSTPQELNIIPCEPDEREPSPKRRGSSAIGRLITDLTREFGDNPALALPNISRALNLWHTTTLSERAFLDLRYQARRKTRECVVISHRRNFSTTGATGSQANRMPYFFKVLSDSLSNLTTQTGNSGCAPLSTEKRPQISLHPAVTPLTGGFLDGAATASFTSKIEKECEEGADSSWTGDLTSIWQAVCEALRGRFQSTQLAETALKMKPGFGASQDQLVLTAPGLPWLAKMFTNSDLAVLRLALRQVAGRGFELIVV